MKKLILLLLGFCVATAAYGQVSDVYFHEGAQSYIHADLQAAIDEVQTGLIKYPNDVKLNALMEKLKEERKKQQQNQQQKSQQNKENKDQEQQDQQQDEQQKKDDQQKSDGENQEQQDPQKVNPDEAQSKQISKEDAEKILNALAQKEKELLKEFKKKKTKGSAKHEKDW